MLRFRREGVMLSKENISRNLKGKILTGSEEKSCRIETVIVQVIPRKRFKRIKTTKAVLASRNKKEAGYIIGVIDQLERKKSRRM